MKHRAAVFDFDGTLVDTLDDLADSMNAVLAELGLPPQPVDDYRYHVGQGMANLARLASPAGTPGETIDRIVSMMRAHYGANWANKTRPYRGIPELLAALRERGLRLAILSNKPDEFTRAMAAHYFPGDTFAIVRGALPGVSIKPDPGSALEIAREFGLKPAEIIYLGDTDVDMRTGLAAGMFTVGVTWGFRPIEELRNAGARAIVDAPAEILDLLQD